jgi:putative ABC transport system substrate-binding protein
LPDEPGVPFGENWMVSRRNVVLTLGAAALAAPIRAFAQQTPLRLFRVGFLATGGRTPDGLPPGPLREGLRSEGYVEGRNIAFEARFADGVADRVPGLAAELVQLKVDVIVTQGWPATLAAKQATSNIPIVMAPAAGDAVATELIASLARPGGNVTGMSDESVALSAKRMQLLKEAVPKAALVAILWNTNDRGMTMRYREIDKAARMLQVEVQAYGVHEPDDFARAFDAMTKRRPDAIFLVSDTLTRSNRKSLIDFAASNRIPAMYEFGFYVRDGGLMSYGPSADDDFHEAAIYVDRILKGARAADLPAQQPTRYYLTINRSTAAALGLTLPPSLLSRADEVIE